MSAIMEDWAYKLEQNLKAEILFAVATVAAGPDGIGSKLFVYPDASTDGAFAARIQPQVVADACVLMSRELSETRAYEDYQVFIQVWAPPPRLVIVGAVHTAIPLAAFAKSLGFRTIVVDGRAQFATPDRFPEVDELIVGWPDEALKHLPLDQATYVVILTHDPKFDLPALRTLASGRARYVGAMGSRETRRKHMEQLRAEGLPQDFLDSVYGPVGLDLGARSPEEMALAIMAEVIAVRYRRPGGHLKPAARHDLEKAILEEPRDARGSEP